jgi:hypothetical protein
MNICNGQLVKRVVLKNRVVKYYPIHYYCYASLINCLEKLLQKPGFPERCEEWRERGHLESEQMTDMFGQLWKDFPRYNGNNFLNVPRNYRRILILF